MRIGVTDLGVLGFPSIFPRLNNLKPVFRKDPHGFSRMLRRRHVGARYVIGRQITADHPPADPFGSCEASNSPDRRTRSNVPRRPFADSTVIDVLRAHVIGDDLLLLGTPALLH